MPLLIPAEEPRFPWRTVLTICIVIISFGGGLLGTHIYYTRLKTAPAGDRRALVEQNAVPLSSTAPPIQTAESTEPKLIVLPRPPYYDWNVEMRIVSLTMSSAAERRRHVSDPDQIARAESADQAQKMRLRQIQLALFNKAIKEIKDLGALTKIQHHDYFINEKIWIEQTQQIKLAYVGLFCGNSGGAPIRVISDQTNEILAESDWKNGHRLMK